jgi:small-conductance mechanosensitive channel
VIAAFLLLMFSGVIDSFVLSHLSLDPNAEVAVELIKTFGTAFIGYLAADTGDHYSANRFGRNEEDI